LGIVFNAADFAISHGGTQPRWLTDLCAIIAPNAWLDFQQTLQGVVRIEEVFD
jgi:hypothetical protein